MILYRDHFPTLGSTYQEVQSHTVMAVTLLESLGFIIHKGKSCIIDIQVIPFPGFVINPIVETLGLMHGNVIKVKSFSNWQLQP